MENNINTVISFIQELLVNKKMELYDEIIHEDYRWGFLHVKDGVKLDPLENKEFVKSIPYLKCEILELVAQDNKVVVFNEFTIKITNDYMRELVHPSEFGKTTTFLNTTIFHLKDNKIWKADRVFDKYSLYKNLGLLDRVVQKDTQQLFTDYINKIRKMGIIE